MRPRNQTKPTTNPKEAAPYSPKLPLLRNTNIFLTTAQKELTRYSKARHTTQDIDEVTTSQRQLGQILNSWFPRAHTYHNHRWAVHWCPSMLTAKWFQIPGQSLNTESVVSSPMQHASRCPIIDLQRRRTCRPYL